VTADATDTGPETAFCPGCGAELDADPAPNFCRNCGREV
jgi:predicted amidophosphoribosyltransferase